MLTGLDAAHGLHLFALRYFGAASARVATRLRDGESVWHLWYRYDTADMTCIHVCDSTQAPEEMSWQLLFTSPDHIARTAWAWHLKSPRVRRKLKRVVA